MFKRQKNLIKNEAARFKGAASVNKNIYTAVFFVVPAVWSLLDPARQIYGGVLIRIGTAGVLHLNVHKSKRLLFETNPDVGM
jgi:hypothetical protein